MIRGWFIVGAASALFGCSGKDGEDGPTPDSSPTTPEVSATLVGHGVTTCAAALDRGALGPFERRTSPVPVPSDAWTWAGGISAGDLDGDGWLDLIAPVEPALELYVGSADGVFVSGGASVFGGFDVSFASGVSMADYDGDGDLDVYVTRVVGDPAPEGGTLGRNRLLRNDGDLQFTDVTDQAGVDACGPHHRTGAVSCFKSMSSSWGDYDLDGDLDLFVGNYGYVDETDGTTQDQMDPAEPSFLYRNEGDGTFTNVSDLLPDELHDGYTYVGGFYDLDADGDVDIYTVNDFGNKWPNRVVWNEGGTLVFDPNDASGLVRSMTGMGLALGDFNDDGWIDLGIPEWNNNIFFESRSELGIWIDAAQTRGFTLDRARGQKVGWGSEAGDVDNDGDLDIVSMFGHLLSENSVWVNPTNQPDALYLNEPDGAGSWRFQDRAVEWGCNDPFMNRGAVLADLNRDGWLDIGKRNLIGDNVVYLSRCGSRGWLTVHLRQPGTQNVFAVGARVEVVVGDRTWTRHLIAGGTGFGSAAPLELHFGLGEVDAVDALRVVWPDGVVSELDGVEARQQVTITRGG